MCFHLESLWCKYIFCVCVCVLSGASREAAHVLCEPGVKLRNNQRSSFVHVGRLGSPTVGPLRLDLALHLPPGLST